MTYALVHYPAIDVQHIDELRRKYDPQVDLIAPHLTLLFPLPTSIVETDLVSHIGEVLNGWKPFAIQLHGFQQSSDNYLFLLVREGKGQLIRLHDELYSGLLTLFHRKDLTYVPHLTLGYFGSDPAKCAKVLQDAERLMLEYRSVVDRLHLVKVSEDRTRIVWDKEFLLPG